MVDETPYLCTKCFFKHYHPIFVFKLRIISNFDLWIIKYEYCKLATE